MQNEKQFSDVSIQVLSASIFRACRETPNSESEKNANTPLITDKKCAIMYCE